jgi:hypothetical protein
LEKHSKQLIKSKIRQVKNSDIALQQESVRRFNQARICDLLQWTQTKYNHFLFNGGIEFLSAYIGKDDPAVNRIAPRMEFWNWWKGLWNARDASFLEDVDGREDELPLRRREELYRIVHNVNILAAEIHPPRQAYPKDFVHHKIEM